MVKDKSIVGDLINFRGLVYAPINELGVVFVFGKVMDDLNIYIEEIKQSFPDCIARRKVGNGWEKIKIEFEYDSKSFKMHGHPPDDCDIIVCWEHNWKDCPIEVIELREVVEELKRQDRQEEEGKEELEEGLEEEGTFYEVSEQVQPLLNDLLSFLQTLSDEIVIKRVKLGYTIYSPKRVFIYIYLRKTSLHLLIFIRGQELENVTPGASTCILGGKEVKVALKWGFIDIKSADDIEKYQLVLRKSFELIKEAVSLNERTGYYAQE